MWENLLFFNALLNEDRAIVSHIAGTTGDTIEDEIIIGGINFRFIDTAGIRETKDEIETMGIKKTFEKINPGTSGGAFCLTQLPILKWLQSEKLKTDIAQIKTNSHRNLFCYYQ